MNERMPRAPISLETIAFTMSVPDAALARLRSEFPLVRFVVVESDADPDESALRDTDAIVGWNLAPETLAVAQKMRWFHAAGAGVERFDLAAIAGRGLVMTNSSGVSAPNMAEHVLGMMIALTRRFPQLLRSQARREWRDHETHGEVSELQGQIVLVVGTGDVGLEVARRAVAFGLRVHGLRRRGGSLPGFDAMYTSDQLALALADADHVVVTVPETPRTRHLLDAAAFAAMKPGTMIYNVGRGGVIDTDALIAALASGHVAGAGLDVTDPEPLPATSPLWEMPNVLITAHTSGATPRYWDRQTALIAENIRRLQRGEPPRNRVDLDEGY
jgi:phosphoglycerate dehydrogenase-like enzyme